MRQIILLVIGLGIGIAGSLLFSQSLPPDPGSAEERAEKAEVELKKARKEIAAFEAVMGKNPAGRFRNTFTDRTRRIAEDIKAGRPVSVDDVFDATKPLMRDLAPLFERIRFRDQKRSFDTLAGSYSRKYELNPAEKKALEEHLDQKAEENASRFFEILTSDTSRFEDFARASEDFEDGNDLDEFMQRTLQGEKLDQYRIDRLNERVIQVQKEADRNVERLDTIVGLDENQKDQVFAFMARSARGFDPMMEFEGLTGETEPLRPGQSRNEAILQVLRPEQRTAFEEHRKKQREAAEEDLRSIGLSLPEDWDLLDEGDF